MHRGPSTESVEFLTAGKVLALWDRRSEWSHGEMYTWNWICTEDVRLLSKPKAGTDALPYRIVFAIDDFRRERRGADVLLVQQCVSVKFETEHEIAVEQWHMPAQRLIHKWNPVPVTTQLNEAWDRIKGSWLKARSKTGGPHKVRIQGQGRTAGALRDFILPAFRPADIFDMYEVKDQWVKHLHQECNLFTDSDGEPCGVVVLVRSPLRGRWIPVYARGPSGRAQVPAGTFSKSISSVLGHEKPDAVCVVKEDSADCIRRVCLLYTSPSPRDS